MQDVNRKFVSACTACAVTLPAITFTIAYHATESVFYNDCRRFSNGRYRTACLVESKLFLPSSSFIAGRFSDRNAIDTMTAHPTPLFTQLRKLSAQSC